MSLAWGGHANGKIPANAMHAVPNFVPIFSGVSTGLASNMMMTEAAVQFSGLAQAFYRKFNKALNVSEAYRRLDRQQSLYADYKAGRGNLAAYPGTSNHGWGRSLDLASGVNINGSAENTWARQNAPSYGFAFTVPSEAWHVDYLGSPSVRVADYISDPNTTSTPTTDSNQGDEGVDRLIRNKKTGSIDWINTATGFFWHTPNIDYVNAVAKFIGRSVEDMEDNWWSFYRDRCTEQRAAIGTAAANRTAPAVWDAAIDGYNGKQTASARLAGIDKKAATVNSDGVKAIVAALPASSGGAGVDIDALAKAIAPLVAASIADSIAKAVSDDIAKRMQS